MGDTVTIPPGSVRSALTILSIDPRGRSVGGVATTEGCDGKRTRSRSIQLAGTTSCTGMLTGGGSVTCGGESGASTSLQCLRCFVASSMKRASGRLPTRLLIDPYDSSQDAVYLHTRNPNEDNFPYQFEGVTWGANVPERLRDFITDPSWEFGRGEDPSYTTYFVVRPRSR